MARCAPRQKSLIAMQLKNLNLIVCSVGDGGNDVGMIRVSNIGIGIEGKEGKQASLAADVSIKKFENI